MSSLSLHWRVNACAHLCLLLCTFQYPPNSCSCVYQLPVGLIQQNAKSNLGIRAQSLGSLIAEVRDRVSVASLVRKQQDGRLILCWLSFNLVHHPILGNVTIHIQYTFMYISMNIIQIIHLSQACLETGLFRDYRCCQVQSQY